MFIPIGDDVNTRTLPLMATILICVNIMLWVHTETLMVESIRAQQKEFESQNRRQIGWDEDGDPVFEQRAPEGPKKRNPDADKWKNFITEWGVVPTALAKGEFHGIFSYMFLHADFFHLLGNMLFFWAFAGTLEATLGKWTMLFLYLFWGMAAGLIQALFNWGGDVPCIGASGAIAGVMGAYFLCFGALSRIKVWIWLGFIIPGRVYHIPAGLFLTIWIFLQIWDALEAARNPGLSNVGFAAHFGGFGVGMLTMFLFRGEVQAKLKMTREGRFELKREDEVEAPRSSKTKVVMVESADAASGPSASDPAAAPEPAAPAVRACTRCKTTLADENRVMDQLFRCPNCKMLVDLAPPPPPTSGSKNKRRSSGLYG